MSRRYLLGLAGAAAAGAAGAAIVTASPAAATTGNFQFGAANDAGTDTTSLTSTSTTRTLLVENTSGTPTTAFKGVSSLGAGIEGSSTSSNGVTAQSSSGVGVSGISSSSDGVRGTSTTGNSLFLNAPTANTTGAHMKLNPGSTAGAPTAGAHTLGQFWMDSAGVLFKCTETGTPGIWRPVMIVGTTNDDPGNEGTSLTNNSTNDTTLLATNNGTGRALDVMGGTAGTPVMRVQSNSTTNGAHIWLSPSTTTGAPNAGNHEPGELFMDSAGTLFSCTAEGTPGTWVRHSPFVPLTAPVRIYNTKTTNGPAFSPNQERTVGLTNGTSIPHTASAVLVNLACNAPAAAGFLAMWKEGTWPLHSNLNFVAGAAASNNATSALVAGSPSTAKIRSSTTTHVIVDVLGYYA